MAVYDALGQAHALTFLFARNTTAQEWEYKVLIPDVDINASGTLGNFMEMVASADWLSTPTAVSTIRGW